MILASTFAPDDNIHWTTISWSPTLGFLCVRQLRGHFDPVQCCAYRSRSQELITCSTDGLVLLWSAPVNGNGRAGATRASYLGLGHRGHDDLGDEDAWSSDEDEKRRTGSTLLGSGADANKTNSPTASTAGRGGGREGFVPPILMQERRYGSGGRGRWPIGYRYSLDSLVEDLNPKYLCM